MRATLTFTTTLGSKSIIQSDASERRCAAHGRSLTCRHGAGGAGGGVFTCAHVLQKPSEAVCIKTFKKFKKSKLVVAVKGGFIRTSH